MSLANEILYRVGFTPWERMAELPVRDQISALLDREQGGRQPPYGAALDLGCGSGIWSVELAKRGWQVTGIDIVPTALRRARERAQEAGVDVRLVHGDLTALRAANVGSDFRLMLDFQTLHDLTQEQRVAIGREVSAVAAPDATLLMIAWALRKALGRGLILTQPPGHLIRVSDGELDLHRFERLVATARAEEPAQAARLLREGLALWRGAPLAELGDSFARAERTRLEEQRLAALEQRIEAELADQYMLGRGDVVDQMLDEARTGGFLDCTSAEACVGESRSADGYIGAVKRAAT